MTGSGTQQRFRAVVMLWLLAALLSSVALGLAVADDTPAAPANPALAPQQSPDKPAPSVTPEPAFPAQPPAAKPGFLSEFGRWWEEGIASFSAKMKDSQSKLDDFNKKSNEATQEAMKNAAKATKDAANAMIRLPTSRMIEIHERCALAGNGAPDCQAAATAACRGKGFNTGQPLDIRTAESCTASLWVSGEKPDNGACPIETMVLRAACE